MLGIFSGIFYPVIAFGTLAYESTKLCMYKWHDHLKNDGDKKIQQLNNTTEPEKIDLLKNDDVFIRFGIYINFLFECEFTAKV